MGKTTPQIFFLNRFMGLESPQKPFEYRGKASSNALSEAPNAPWSAWSFTESVWRSRLLKARLKVLLEVLIRLLKARLKVLLKVLVRLLKARLKVLLKVLVRSL